MTYDSYNQLTQIKKHSFNNWHPFFHTFIEMLVLKIWNNPTAIGLFQIGVFSTIWTCICHYCRNKNDIKTTILQAIITIVICINPINFLYSITLWKDILYSYSILFVCLLIKILLDKKYNVSKIFIVIFALSLAFLAEIRYNGLYITIILVILFSFLFYKKIKKNFILLPIITIAGIAAISSLDIIYNVKDNDKDAVAPKVMQYLTYYIKNNKMSNKDIKLIEKVANKDKLVKQYKDSFTDNLYGVVDIKKYQKNKSKLMKLCFKYTVKYPGSAIDFAFRSTSFIWNPTFSKNRIGLIVVTDITSPNNVDNIMPSNYEKEYYQKFVSIINKTLNNNFLKIILYSAALYFYLTIIVSIILLMKYKYRTLLILLPNILNIIIVAVSNPIHDIRYIYPNILLFYFVVILLIGKVGKTNEKHIKNLKK